MNLIIALRTCSLFSGFSESDLARVAEITKVRSYERGEQVCREGDPATHFYAVVTGEVKLYRLSPEGKYHIVLLISPGQIFAEAVAFSGQTYPVFAEAMTKSRLLILEGKGFLDLVSSEPPLARRVITALSQRLQTVVGVLEQLALSDLTARLAKYFLDLSLKAQRAGANASLVRLDIRKSDLAARLGTVSESLSRSLSGLRQKRIIAVNKNEIRILDPQALARIAAGIRE